MKVAWVAQEAGFPDINIITEKVAFEGVTRFEDRNRLPLGISFNSTSLSASLLIQAAYDPLARPAKSDFYRCQGCEKVVKHRAACESGVTVRE